MNYVVRVGEENFTIKTSKAGAGVVAVNDAPAQVALHRIRENLYSLHWNGEVFTVQIDAHRGEVRLGPHFFEVHVEDERAAALKKLQSSARFQSALTMIKAPMPGLIVRMEVAKGETIQKGQGLLVIEAMKMENEIKSPVAGTVTEIMAVSRMPVEKGAPLLQIKPE